MIEGTPEEVESKSNKCGPTPPTPVPFNPHPTQRYPIPPEHLTPPVKLSPPGKRDYNPIPPKSEATLTAKVVDAKRGEPMPYDSEQQHVPLSEGEIAYIKSQNKGHNAANHAGTTAWLATRLLTALQHAEADNAVLLDKLAECERDRDEARGCKPDAWEHVRASERAAISREGEAKADLLAANRTIAELMESAVRAENIIDVYCADQVGATDPRIGLVQPVTVAEAIELNEARAALRSAIAHTQENKKCIIKPPPPQEKALDEMVKISQEMGGYDVPPLTGLSFSKLREASQSRANYWGPKPTSVEFAAIELAGEAGEVSNAVKKWLRHRLGMKGGVSDLTNLREELGDLVISADLLAAKLGIDLGAAVIEKFNKTSDKHGFPVKLEPKTEDDHGYKTMEPCGHFKNFLVGDEHGNFTCTLCTIQKLEQQLAAWTYSHSPH